MTSDNPELNPYNFVSKIYPLIRLMIGGVRNELALLIPDYQRNYTWRQRDIERFYTDVLSSLSTCTKRPSAHFLGTTVWNLRNRAEEPEFTIDSFDVVDGQQRLTTCVLLTISLIMRIKRNLEEVKAEGSFSRSLDGWLRAEFLQIEEEASSMISGKLRRGDVPFPRIINEEDIRGRTHGDSDFRSPISKLSLTIAKELTEEASFDPATIAIHTDDQDVFQRLMNNIICFSDYLKDIANEQRFEDFNIPFIEKDSLRTGYFRKLYSKSPPDSDFDRALNTSEAFEKHVRLVHFFWHFLRATRINVITCENEDAAFSIFDSLNTTGVPLTAIQTLKPFALHFWCISLSVLR